jgi:molecular chaperone GrpE
MRQQALRQEAMRQQAMRDEQRQRMPTLDDYVALQKAHEELQDAYERQGKEAAKLQQELQIKNEALHRQSADLKNLEAELVWARAAVQQQEQEQTEESQENWAERYARLQAEVENLRKRWEQRFATDTAEARHRILLDMLPLADHLEMALRHAGAEGADDFVASVEAIHRAFLDALKRYDVTPIDALGQPFDPALHEAVGQIRREDTPPGAVAEVVQTGYREGDRLLRPARVLVNQGEHATGQKAEV